MLAALREWLEVVKRRQRKGNVRIRVHPANVHPSFQSLGLTTPRVLGLADTGVLAEWILLVRREQDARETTMTLGHVYGAEGEQVSLG